MKKGNSMTVTNLTYISLFTVLIIICSWITIPIGGIPITLQTFGIFATAYMLGTQRATIALSVYILLGAVGIPVFSGFGSGIGQVLGITGGYILGFFISIWIHGLICKFFSHKIFVSFLASLLGLVGCYAMGTFWFIYVYTGTTGAISIMATLSITVFPFVVFDIIKIIIALLLSKRLAKHISLK